MATLKGGVKHTSSLISPSLSFNWQGRIVEIIYFGEIAPLTYKFNVFHLPKKALFLLNFAVLA